MDDLSLLRLNLGVRDVATREGLAAPLAQVPETRSLAQEIFAKFGGKTQAESRQLVAILTAVQEVVMSQGMEVTPTAMFAALMARCVRLMGKNGHCDCCSKQRRWLPACLDTHSLAGALLQPGEARDNGQQRGARGYVPPAVAGAGPCAKSGPAFQVFSGQPGAVRHPGG